MNMWNYIGDISAVVTLILFVLYVIGHVWKIIIIKYTLQEKFEFVELTERIRNSKFFARELGESGQEFAVSSPNGIRRIEFYKIIRDNELREKSRKTIATYEKIEPNQKVYACVNIPDVCANIGVEIEKTDYIKISFGVADSGRNGELVKENYKCKLTLRSIIYYLCS